MRLLWCFLLCSVFLIAGCKKNRLNQPSYLNFSWQFAENSGSLVTLTGGKFTATQISISGDRKEGDDIDINQSLPSLETSFSSGAALNFQIDVPVGEYLSFVSSLKMAANPDAAVILQGSMDKQGMPVPVRIELSETDVLDFVAQQSFKLDKKHTYSVYLQLVVSKLFQDISNEMWAYGTVSNEPGGTPTLVISEQINHPLYDHITARLSEALTLSVE